MATILNNGCKFCEHQGLTVTEDRMKASREVAEINFNFASLQNVCKDLKLRYKGILNRNVEAPLFNIIDIVYQTLNESTPEKHRKQFLKELNDSINYLMSGLSYGVGIGLIMMGQAQLGLQFSKLFPNLNLVIY